MPQLFSISDFGQHLSYKSLRYYYEDYWYATTDTRTTDFPLMPTPWKLVSIMSVYLIFVTQIGPRFMANRKAYTLFAPMLIYNVGMIVSNLYFFVYAIQWIDWGRKLLEVQFPSREDRSPQTMDQLHFMKIYLLSKFADLLDTVFFVLRKKDRQITALHLYHHMAVPCLGWYSFWCSTIITPGAALFCLLNSFIHVIMYSYYALASFGPQIQKYLWWKRYLTQIQLIQFAILGIYVISAGPFYQGYPRNITYVAFAQPLIFFALFLDFYFKAYRKKGENKGEIKREVNGASAHKKSN